MQKVRVSGVIDQVRVACEFVMRIAHEAGMDDKFAFECQLSVDEICTNIIEHGYHHQGNGKQIEVWIEAFPHYWRITIIDEAPRFNPLIKDDPNPMECLEERQPGGWGIYFVRQYMNTIAYRYENGRNCLIMEKSLSA